MQKLTLAVDGRRWARARDGWKALSYQDNGVPSKRFMRTCFAILLLAAGCASRCLSDNPPPFPVMLGIDTLSQRGFTPLAGKRVGLLTHPAGVNRQGVSTIDILRRAPNVNLVALFGPEHGIYGDERANVPIPDRIDKRTGLPVYSLYGATRRPTPAMLRGLDVMVIDLQDIGSRSYTFISSMLYTMEACFAQNIAVLVLDRPNPMGGEIVDGPMLDNEWKSFVGAFPVPYVHGMTIGELAIMAQARPGIMSIDDQARAQGRLTVIPMQGWKRSMQWHETGLRFIATSPFVPDEQAAYGYAILGLGCQLGGFSHGVGVKFPFRGLSHTRLTADQLATKLNALKLPGLRYRQIRAPNRQGVLMPGLYVDIVDWDALRPTAISFHLMRIACKLNDRNPFATATANARAQFNRHTGSTAWWNALVRDGANVDVNFFLRKWDREARAFKRQSKRYWLYD